MRKNFVFITIFLMSVCMQGCNPAVFSQSVSEEETGTQIYEPTRTPFQPIGAEDLEPVVEENQDAEPIALPEQTPTLPPVVQVSGEGIWINPDLPSSLRKGISIPDSLSAVEDVNQAALHVDVVSGEERASTWIYVLASPFPTVKDEISFEDLMDKLHQTSNSDFSDRPILMASSTRRVLEARFGQFSDEAVKVVGKSALLDTAWEKPYSMAILPFEQLSPRWKAIQIDGMSVFDRDLSISEYPLKVHFGVVGSSALSEQIILPATNRDQEKMTVLVMTGVTALVRATGAKMDTLGVTYPGEKIRDWLVDADYTHISNEVSFDATCPLANPYQTSLQFCSRLEYIELFDYVGVDILELTGNHLMDWGRPAFDSSLDLYREKGYFYYAAGENLAEAQEPLFIEHHGNQLAFIGCNPAGPAYVWASDTVSGVANCDYEMIHAQIERLREEGYLPIVTLQFNESYGFTPGSDQEKVFKAMADAGAVIVSGSQAHYPQGMEFVGNSFVHYGLGNLFFDQMWVPEGWGTRVFDAENLPVPGTRLEFIDRHVFYDGRYIGIEILTAMLEDFAQPRPLTEMERKILLQDAFELSGW